jgi:hypothetical protein
MNRYGKIPHGMRRVWLLAVLAYLALDFADPSIPGVFFFDTEQFFVDATIGTTKADSPRLSPCAGPQPDLITKECAPTVSFLRSSPSTAWSFTRLAARPYLSRSSLLSSLPSDDH